MRRAGIRTGRGFLLAGVLVALGAWAAEPAPPARPPEKAVAFEMRDKPWGSVLEWLSDQTGLPVLTNHKPAGTFTFIAPRLGGSPRKYTIPEVIDLLNEALLNQKY